MIVRNPDPVEWDEFVRSQPGAMVFHSQAWKRVIERTFGYSSLYLAKREGSRVTAVLPLFEVRSRLTGNRLVSVPFSAAAGVLGEDGCEDEFVRYLRREAGADDYSYLLIRSNRKHAFGNEPHSVDDTSIDTDLYLTAPGEEMWNGFPVRIRTAVRKAEKEGLTLHKGRSEGDLRDFYRLMLLTRKGFGAPPFSIAYYRNMLEEFEHATIYAAVFGDVRTNGILMIPWNGCYYYFYVASDYSYRKKCGSDFLVWELIKDAEANGVSRINFGRSDRDKPSLIKFKRKWGSVETPLYFYSLPEAGVTSDRSSLKYRAVKKAFQVMPIQLSRILGPVVTRQLG